MKYLLAVLSILFASQTAHSQDGGLAVTVTGEVELPADRVHFNININAEEKSPQAAYDLHQKREKALVTLLDKYEVSEENIRYEPVSISKIQRNHRGAESEETVYVTHQSVNLMLADFDVYEKIQIGLIENNFDNFSAHFTSSEMEKGKNEALKAAINKARERAQLIAGAAEVKLGSIQQIRYGSDYSPRAEEAYTVKLAAQSSDSMLKYDQTVTVAATITMRYALPQ